MSVFDKRKEFKPSEYPWADEFADRIHSSFWTVKHFTFDSDVDDFHTRLSPPEREAVRRAMLAISQVEVSVKEFWGGLGRWFPKPEFVGVGYVFADSEYRHSHSYSALLELLGLNQDFKAVLAVPAIAGRVDYLTKHRVQADDPQGQALALILFSLLVENVSLFAQFALMKSVNKHRNMMKGVDNVIQATQQEECYAAGTEVLTPSGWVDLREMKVGDPVIEYDHGILRPTTVLHKVDRDYTGEMLWFHDKCSDCLVTPDHDMVYYTPDGSFHKRKARDFRPHSKQFVPRGGLLVDRDGPVMTAEERVRVAIQADASNLYWRNKAGETILRGTNGGATHMFRLTKQRKKERLEQLLQEAGIAFTKKQLGGDEVEYRVTYNQDSDYKTFEWVQLSTRNAKWCEDFVVEASRWDGCTEGQVLGYCNTNKSAIDVVQAAAVMAGFRPTIYTQKKTRRESYKGCYRVMLRRRELLTRGHSIDRETVQYTGSVHCVTVPSGVIVTRRNSKVFVAGNCLHALFGIKLVNTIREERPDLFGPDFYEKVYAACRKAEAAEAGIVDWMLELGDLPYLSRDTLKAFVRHRLNESLEMVGGTAIFEVDRAALATLDWFLVELLARINFDFFDKRPVNYARSGSPITTESLFA